MLELPPLNVGDTIVVQHPSRVGPDIFLVDSFDSEGHPVTRMKSLGTFGLATRFPSDVEGLELVGVIPAPAHIIPPEERLAIALRDNREALASKPHPSPGRAAKGQTLADYVAWALDARIGRGYPKVLALVQDALRTD